MEERGKVDSQQVALQAQRHGSFGIDDDVAGLGDVDVEDRFTVDFLQV